VSVAVLRCAILCCRCPWLHCVLCGCLWLHYAMLSCRCLWLASLFWWHIHIM